MRIRGASTNFSSDPIDRECSIETSVAKVWLYFEKVLIALQAKEVAEFQTQMLSVICGRCMNLPTIAALLE